VDGRVLRVAHTAGAGAKVDAVGYAGSMITFVLSGVRS
jgi:hypothetical protein